VYHFGGTKGRRGSVGGHRGDVVASLGDVDDPEIDLRLIGFRTASNTVTLGEPIFSHIAIGDSNRRRRRRWAGTLLSLIPEMNQECPR